MSDESDPRITYAQRTVDDLRERLEVAYRNLDAVVETVGLEMLAAAGIAVGHKFMWSHDWRRGNFEVGSNFGFGNEVLVECFPLTTKGLRHRNRSSVMFRVSGIITSEPL